MNKSKNTPKNQIATATSAAMVPSEILEAEEQTNEHVIRLIKKGFFPTPNLESQTTDKKVRESKKLVTAIS